MEFPNNLHITKEGFNLVTWLYPEPQRGPTVLVVAYNYLEQALWSPTLPTNKEKLHKQHGRQGGPIDKTTDTNSEIERRIRVAGGCFKEYGRQLNNRLDGATIAQRLGFKG